MLGNLGSILPWGGQMTAADVAPSSAGPDTPTTQELGNPTATNLAVMPTVFGLPPILVAFFGLVGLLYLARAVTVKEG